MVTVGYSVTVRLPHGYGFKYPLLFVTSFNEKILGFIKGAI